MSDVLPVPQKKRRPVRRQCSIYQVHYALQKQVEETAKPLPRPMDPLDVQEYGLQVAGHMKTENQKYQGVLQCTNGTILKPIIKETQKREVDFYETLKSSKNEDLVELRSFTAKYHGCRKFTYNGHEQDYIVLQDLAVGMLEPCIMDVKIGKRTWDPLATPAKIASEQSKYALCKEQFGFCIPGYQVHRLCSGRLYKYGKDCGKKLHGSLVRGAIKNFLNGMGTKLCRVLILQFLSELWKIQKWVSKQTIVRLYSASLLLVYDAAKLRDCCGDTDSIAAHPGAPRRSSVPSAAAAAAGATLSGQLSPAGPVYKPVGGVPPAALALARASFAAAAPPPLSSPWSDALEKLNHNHSFDHNYEDKVCKMKINYRALLDRLSTDAPPSPWGVVKIIDCAHAFFNEDDHGGIDHNFKGGIDTFVAIFEELLKETVDQDF